MLSKKRGQSALEYALVITVAILALIAVNVYMKRGIQGRLKSSTDEIGRQFEANRFETSWRSTGTGLSNTTETRAVGGGITSNTQGTERVARDEFETFGNATTSRY